MSRSVLPLIVFLIAATAFADEPARPDYSRQALLRMFAPLLDEPPRHPGRVQWHVGYAVYEFRAFGTDWRIAWRWLMAPLPGTRLNELATPPNPFALTGTRYASTMPPMFDTDRSWAVERELRRIERLERKRRLTVRSTD